MMGSGGYSVRILYSICRIKLLNCVSLGRFRMTKGQEYYYYEVENEEMMIIIIIGFLTHNKPFFCCIQYIYT